MMPRDGRQERRRRPLDQLLGGGGGIDPTKPYGGVRPTGRGTAEPVTPVDAALGGGEENPWVNPFMEVYETTKTGAMANLADIQKQMGESFAHRGGYFGGKHAISQADVATKTGTYLDQLLAETSLGASEREYEDWQRARQEQFMPMQLINTLLGQDTFENIVQQPGQGKGGGAGSALGGLAGSFLGPVGTAAGTAAGKKWF